MNIKDFPDPSGRVRDSTYFEQVALQQCTMEGNPNSIFSLPHPLDTLNSSSHSNPNSNLPGPGPDGLPDEMQAAGASFLGDMDPVNVPPDMKKGGDDWFAVFYPKVKRVLDVSLVHTPMHDKCVENLLHLIKTNV